MTSAVNFQPANRAPLLALLAGNAVSLVGNTLTAIAVPWFVLETTGSASKTGLTGFFVALPAFLAGVLGGTLVDRFGYKRVSVISDLVSGVGIVLVPAFYFTVGLAFWQLLALVFVGALLDIPGLTARRAMLPELAALAGWRLERVNALYEGMQYLSFLLGPPLAGLLIAAIGTANVLWLDAVTFAVSAALVALAIPAVAGGTAGAAGGKYLDELAAGLRFLWRDRLLFTLAVGLAITNFLGNPAWLVVLPVYVKETFNSATVLGLLNAAFGAGSLLGAAVYGAIGHRLPRRATWIAGFATAALPFAVLALTAALPPIVAATVASAIVGGPLNPLLVTIRHERIPAALRGRVFSTFSAITAVASPLGMLLAGNIIEWFGLPPTLWLLTAAYLLVAAAMLFLPALRDMDRPAPAQPVGDVAAQG